MPRIDPMKPADQQLQIVASDRRILERAEKLCDVLAKHNHHPSRANAARNALISLQEAWTVEPEGDDAPTK